MRIYFDNWLSCFVDSGFSIEMNVIPRVGDTLVFHKSLVNERFFDPMLNGKGNRNN
jgi:hypothetical protein